MTKKSNELLAAISKCSLRELLEIKLSNIVGMVSSVNGNHNLYEEVITETEAVLLKSVLTQTKTQLEAAQVLGINRNTLRKKIKELNIETEK